MSIFRAKGLIFSFECVTYAKFETCSPCKMCIPLVYFSYIALYKRKPLCVQMLIYILSVFLNCTKNSSLNSAALIGHSPCKGLWKVTICESHRLFYVLLTVQPCIKLLMCLLLFSTCFGQLCAHHQEKLLYLCDT